MKLYYLLCLLPTLLVAMEGRVHDFSQDGQVWITGPLITPSAVVVQGGHMDVEPYVYAYAYSANYNRHWGLENRPTFWSLSSQTLVQLGINQWMDISFTPIVNWSHVRNAANWSLGDVTVNLDFQLYRNQFPQNDKIPSIRFTLSETAPFGKYRNLDPMKQSTDAGGGGSWVSFAGFGVSDIIRLGSHFFIYRFNVQCGFPAPIHVKGFHAYGGGFGTNGTIYPGINGQLSGGFEYTLTQNWVLALDVIAKWFAKNRFSGISGVNTQGLTARNGGPSSSQYSLAPALEYNWNQNLGIIGGVWFTVAGKNISQFNSLVVALNYYK